MAIEVRIPTILRTYTDGAKNGRGLRRDARARCSTTSRRATPGIHDRIVDDGGLRRFVNVYVNDEDVRFLGGIDTRSATATSSRSAGRRRRLTRDRALRLAAGLGRAHPARRAAAAVAVADVRLWAKLEDRNPTGSVKDRAALT
jgi:sulfur-carrier protein